MYTDDGGLDTNFNGCELWFLDTAVLHSKP